MSGNVKNSPHIKLQNSFIDVCLVVGVDEDSGLIPIDKEFLDLTEDIDDDVFNLDFEAPVLAAVSVENAVYFFPYPREDLSYPPASNSMYSILPKGNSTRNLLHRGRSSDAGKAHDPSLLYARNKSIAPGSAAYKKHSINKKGRSCSISPAMISRHYSQSGLKGTRRKSRAPSLPNFPLSEDTMRSVNVFCYPDNLQLKREKPAESVHYLVLTDASALATKTYATCLTFYKKHCVIQSKDEEALYLKPCSISSDDNEEEQVCYAPKCLVLISKYPYFTKLKECLSLLAKQVEGDPEEMYTFVKEMTFTLCMTPVPPAGIVGVKLNLYQVPIYLQPSDYPGKPVIDLPIHLVFLCFSVKDVLTIITCIFLEFPLVFLSSSYSLLPLIMESFLSFILPFTWRGTYVPILSSTSLEFLEAPGYFMMGCHSRHKRDVLKIEGITVIDIDMGTITVNQSRDSDFSFDQGYEEFHELLIPPLPKDAAELFIRTYEKSRFHFDLLEIQRPSSTNLADEKDFRRTQIEKFNQDMSTASLELMVNLFRCVLSEMRFDLRRFNKQAFLEARPEEEKIFYEKVLSTDMFRQFMETRLNEKIDYWSELESKTRPFAPKIPSEKDFPPNTVRTQRRKERRASVALSLLPFALERREITYFELPVFVQDIKHYMTSSKSALTVALENCNDFRERSSYLYLRGMFYVSEGNSATAMEDFMNLSTTNTQLIPSELMEELYKKLSPVDRDVLAKRWSLDKFQQIVCPGSPKQIRRKSIMEPVTIPDKDLGEGEFIEIVSLLEVVSDYDTIQKLFKSLTLFQDHAFVDQNTFQLMYICWQENQSQCEDIQIEGGKLVEDELILKVSSLIKTDYGNGRIVLTDRRLFFLKDVTNKYKEIIKVKEIEVLEKIQLVSLFHTVDALRITSFEKSTFVACLKDERDLWHMLVQEMRSAKTISYATKDITAIQRAAQNVMLIDALVRSGREEVTTHHADVQAAASNLCHFTNIEKQGKHVLPAATLEALQQRVDPNVNEKERHAVRALLFVSGEPLKNLPPRLFCGLGNGKVKVYNAMTWVVEDNYIQTRGTVEYLAAIKPTEIWAGSHGVFIIDTDTVTCTKTLMDHHDLVTGIALGPDQKYVYTASVDGVIITWDIKTLKVKKKISVDNFKSLRSMHLQDEQLWCGFWDGIAVLNREGELLKEFRHSETNPSLPAYGKSIDIDCFVSTTLNEVWAGFRREGRAIIWNKEGQVLDFISVNARGISVMKCVRDKVWIGTKEGQINIFSAETHQLMRILLAHDDSVRAMCSAEDRYLMSGSGSKDGKIALWTPELLELDSGSFNVQF